MRANQGVIKTETLQLWFLRAGVVISSILLIRFAIDFWMGMKWWLALPFLLLVVAALAVSAFNAIGSKRVDGYADKRSTLGRLLLAAIPLGCLEVGRAHL